MEEPVVGGLLCFGSNPVCCSFCFAFGGGVGRGEMFPHSVCDMYCKEIEDEHQVCISQREAGGQAGHQHADSLF